MSLFGAVLLFVTSAATATQDTMRLAELRDAAVRNDPRTAQVVLRVEALELQRENLRAERLPVVGVRAEGARQSDVMVLPGAVDGGRVTPPRDRFQVAVDANQLIYDGGLLARREAVEAARHAEALAALEAALYALRAEVNAAFFAVLMLQARESEFQLLVQDLETRLGETRAAVREGAALAGDTAAIESERLAALLRIDETYAERRAAQAVLSQLTGRPVSDQDVLALPNQAQLVAQIRSRESAEELRERPEFRGFALLRERLQREAEFVASRTTPRVHAFGQGGVGRPGPFLPFDDGVNDFWSFGLRMEWQPGPWGTTGRERNLLRIQAEVATTEEAAFAAALERQVAADEEGMDRLERALVTGERIVSLREQIERQAGAQLREGSITASQYVTARTDLLTARLEQQRRRIEMEQVRARYLTLLGVNADD